MSYPIKTLSQLPLMLKGFRKVRGLTQAAMAERLGITQQSYAHFEANPATATLERLFVALRLLGVEISLDQTGSAASTSVTPSVKIVSGRPGAIEVAGHAPSMVVAGKAKPSVAAKASRIVDPTGKKESW